MSLFPRIVSNDFAPMFRLMEDYANHVSARAGANGFSQSITNSYRSFTPKFNVKEETDRYVLEGELPGIAQQDVNIEFTDSSTLAIKGRTETVREEGTTPNVLLEGQKSQAAIENGETAASYHKASVEDETAPAVENSAEVAKTDENTKSQETPASKYWVSERSVGEFARSFSFPSKVDHDNVKASMKNGILSVIVPKAPAPVNKRVVIE